MPCDVALIGPRYGADLTQLLFDLTNRGTVADSLVGLDVNVAQFDPLSRSPRSRSSRRAAPFRSCGRTSRSAGAAVHRARLSEPVTLAAGESVTLRFLFAKTFRPTGRAEEIVTVRADFGETCEVWNIPQGVEAPASTSCPASSPSCPTRCRAAAGSSRAGTTTSRTASSRSTSTATPSSSRRP
ncbi:MAG: hypothetical protein U0470_06455 [Anaerolineae bacterium]